MNKLWPVFAVLMGFASTPFAADSMIGLNYQVTTVTGTSTQTYTIAIDSAGSGKYYSGVLRENGVRLTGPKTGNQLCMTTEALYDTAFTFCFNAGVKYDRKAFSTVTTWAEEGRKVILYSDVYRATVVRYRLRPTAFAVVATGASDDGDTARIRRGLAAFAKLEEYKPH